MSSTSWSPSLPTEDDITIYNQNFTVNNLGDSYTMLMFASVDWVSKVWNYVWDWTSWKIIDAWFTLWTKYLLIKRTDTSWDWYIWDNQRWIIEWNDPFIRLNSSTLEVTNDDSIDPNNSWFIVNQTWVTNVNVDWWEYIYYAISE